MEQMKCKWQCQCVQLSLSTLHCDGLFWNSKMVNIVLYQINFYDLSGLVSGLVREFAITVDFCFCLSSWKENIWRVKAHKRVETFKLLVLHDRTQMPKNINLDRLHSKFPLFNYRISIFHKSTSQFSVEIIMLQASAPPSLRGVATPCSRQWS